MPKRKGERFTKPHHDVTLALGRYDVFLTAEQVRRLLYAKGSLKFAKEILLQLRRDWGFCFADLIPRSAQHGKGETTYSLTPKGTKYLTEHDLPLREYYRPSDIRALSPAFKTHIRAVNDFLITLELFCRQFPQLEVYETVSERQLRATPMLVPNDQAEEIAVIFDKWVDLRCRPQGRWCLALEYDTGHEREGNFKARIRSRARAAVGAYQQRFETDILTYTYFTDAGRKRVADMVSWTEEELTEIGAEDLADLFCFRLVDISDDDPSEVFLSPSWYQPFSEDPTYLLDRITDRLGASSRGGS